MPYKQSEKGMDFNMKVIIAASQTGGHINPGIAIANKIKQENPDAVSYTHLTLPTNSLV